MKYKLKTHTVDAFQWDGFNTKLLEAALPVDSEFMVYDLHHVNIILSGNRILDLEPGDWLIYREIDGRDTIVMMPNHMFKNIYEQT